MTAPGSNESALAELVASASTLYRGAGRWAYHFARGKLGADPLFAELLTPGLLPARARYLDLGCGQGLLAAWLLAAMNRDADAPQMAGYLGIDLLDAALRRARLALADREVPIHFEALDLSAAALPDADVVCLIDVLHYLEPRAQERLLRRIRARLPGHGCLLVRVGDAAAGRPYRLSQWTDQLVAFAHSGHVPALHGRTLGTWQELLAELGFRCSVRPMRGTGFANLLIVARPG
jgi:SAM-dependent methyltransferase